MRLGHLVDGPFGLAVLEVCGRILWVQAHVAGRELLLGGRGLAAQTGHLIINKLILSMTRIQINN
jgi:hypothetical protein